MASRGHNGGQSGHRYRMGGILRAPMRNIGGIKAPSFGVNKKVTGLAATNRDEGTVGSGGVEVGGLPAGKSLARPGRKAFAHGGRVPEPGGVSCEAPRERSTAERLKDWDKPISAEQSSLGQSENKSPRNGYAAGGHVRLTRQGGGDNKNHTIRLGGKDFMGPDPLPKPEKGGRGQPAVEVPLPEGSDSDRRQYKDGGIAHHHDDDDEDDREHKKHGGPLTAKRRNALPTKSFAGPDRSYPINDPNHARNALSRVSQHGSPELKERVRAAVHRKYPGIGSDGE